MADFTTYKALELPKSNEKYNVNVANKNSMVIDSELHKLEMKNQSQDELLATKEALDSKLSTHNTSDSSHADMRLLISELTTDKVDKISGKGLSTNDFTNEKNEKLEGIAADANKTTYTNSLVATVPGTALDAVQGKVLNDKGSQISVYKGDDGNLHFRDWTGADSVIPFKNIVKASISFYSRRSIAGGQVLYVLDTDTMSTGNACEYFSISESGSTIYIKILKSGYFDIFCFAITNLKKTHEYIDAGTTYSLGFGTDYSTSARILINAY